MTPEEKQAELIRYRDNILATLDHLNLQYSGSFVTDGWDSAVAYYDQQRLQAEKYFQHRRLDRLEQQLRRLTKLEKMAASSKKARSRHTETIKQTEQDGRELTAVRVFAGPKPSFLEEQEAVSPDGKRRVLVTQWRKGKSASTSVSILFETANGPVYGTMGNHPDIRAFWKDNDTVVIETRRDYFAAVRHKEVRSYNDIVTIEYVEH